MSGITDTFQGLIGWRGGRRNDSTKPGLDGRPPIVANSSLVTIVDPDSPAAEEYRKLKTTLGRQGAVRSGRRVLVVTSCVSGEGKSLTAINLAVTMAQDTDRGVLLIDADLRRPSLAGYLGIEEGAGLSGCLRSGTPVRSAVIGTVVPRLEILPAGQAVRNPVELLASPSLGAVLEELKARRPDQMIVIDTPPILPFAETQALAARADGILFVVREGAVTTHELQDALENIDERKLLGVVFNNVTAQGTQRRYAHYYRYYAEKRHSRD